jgi:hypothetical protein
MRKLIHVVSTCLPIRALMGPWICGPAIVSAFMIFTAGANAQSSTIIFQGLAHTAVGRAVLRLDQARPALTVATFDPSGEDGVAVALKEAISWTARMEATGDVSLPLGISWHAVADSQRISSASMRRVGKTFEIGAVFTGATRPTYGAYVYSDGRLVGSLGGLEPTAHVVVPESFCRVPEFAAILNCRMVSRFHNVDAACAWEWIFSEKVAMRLPNGTVATGNELRLVEEVRPAGHYLYETFHAVQILSNADLTLLAETVR